MQGKRASLMSWLFGLLAVVLIVGRPALAAPYTLVAGDTISVKVVDEPDYSKSYTVTDQGTIFVPNIGNVTVSGKTADDVKADLTKRLKEYIKTPVVTVEITSPITTSVWVTGEVNNPGEVKLKPDARFLDVIQKAGGLRENADRANAKLQRRGEEKARVINLDALLRGDLSLNEAVEAGDTLYIPPKAIGKIKIFGAVNGQGEKDFKRNMTVLEAINTAGGFKEDADKTNVTLQHKDGSTMALNLEKAAKGESDPAVDTMYLQEDDVIRVSTRPKESTIIVSGPGTKSPGTFQYEEGMTVVDAVTKAGGFADRARQKDIHVVRKGGAPLTVDLNRFYKTADSSLNPPLQRGDTVIVAQDEQKTGSGRPKIDPLAIISTITSVVYLGWYLRH